MEQKTKKGCLWIVISILIIIMFLIAKSTINEKRNNNIKAKIEACIESEDFTKAKKLQKKLHEGIWDDDIPGFQQKICRAQVSSLIEKGEYHLAGDIAREDGDYGIYVNIILDRLSSIYSSDKQNLALVLSSISFPIIGETEVWNGSTNYFTFNATDLNKFISNYNMALSSLLKLAKSNGDEESLKVVSSYLLPQYKKVKYQKLDWDVHLQKDVYVDAEKYEDAPSDYTEANKIKKELGIK